MRINSSNEDILLRTDSNGAVFLSLNRPDKLNTLSEAMLIALQTELDDIAVDPSVRCVVISAEGRGFCAGHDLQEMRSHPEREYYQALFKRCGKMMQSIVALPVPVIAKVSGIAAAAGCQLVASCDLVIAARSARFAVPGINVGLFCSTPAVALSRSISAKRAFDMLVTGDVIDAETALDWGLISSVVADEELDDAVAAKVVKILSKSPSAVRYGKSMFNPQRQMSLSEAYEFAGNVMAENMMSPDAGEGIDAFLEKRKPTWVQPTR
ncbi:enoyl-CoA hydratase [Marinobacterium ramblicola]|uniref:enoyl-CoA hydratase n=1 Tax=Marinobacterium ramblicola TaxID=2849041 RepID=UPI003CCED176